MKSRLKEMAALNKYCITFLLLLLAAGGMAQKIPLLEQKVTLDMSDEPVEKALKLISKEAKITFSYTSSDIDIEQNVSASLKAKTVREGLELIFQGSVSFKEKGKYIILSKVPLTPKKTSAIQPKNPMFINGYMLNAATGEKISGVSVHDSKTLTAAVSNEFGYFSMMLKEPQNETRLTVSRKNFADTVLVLKEDTYVFVNVHLTPEITPTIRYDTTSIYQDTVFIVQPLPKGDTILLSALIIKPPYIWNDPPDTLIHKPIQGSIIPSFGTNGKLSDHTINDYSFNLIGGYSAGTKKLELGGLFNIDLGDVSYFQMAGLMNFNEGWMRGFQTAGLFNTNRKGFKGFQLAGITNVSNGRSDGAQVAGIINVHTKQFRGAQVAGILNISKRRMKGVQVAPIFNYASNLKGMQIGLSMLLTHCVVCHLDLSAT